MFDLEEHLRHWREETEATLAFDLDELDELEDHLRLAYASALKEKLPPETAWPRARAQLGPASALALEFTKNKLLPALVRLLIAWGQPSLLLLILTAPYLLSLTKYGPSSDSPYTTWMMAGASAIGLIAVLLFLPDKAQKNAVIAGTGLALCLIPWLHLAAYNPLTESWIGRGWQEMALPFGWLPFLLSFLGLIGITVWWRKHSTAPERIPSALATAGCLIFLIALAPFCSELVGNLSLHPLYQLPDASRIPFTGESRTSFLVWKFIEITAWTCAYVVTLLPPILVAVASTGTWLLGQVSRRFQVASSGNDPVFPSHRDLPWMLLLGASGLFGVLSHETAVALDNQFQSMADRAVPILHLEWPIAQIMVLVPAALFLVTIHKLIQSLKLASHVRPFYALLPLMMTALVLLALPILNATDNPARLPGNSPRFSHNPVWLVALLTGLTASFAIRYGLLVIRKIRTQAIKPSLWRFKGPDLVQFGLLLGLMFACSCLALIAVALVMAYDSVVMISDLIHWGNFIKAATPGPFHPSSPAIGQYQMIWIALGFIYLSLCLAAGLFSAIILSGLEFIRFNCFRIYKVRKIRLAATAPTASSLPVAYGAPGPK